MAIQTALVVDDSRSARFILQRLLERQHVSVDGVGTAHEAMSYLREYLPDVVFMDDMMPGMEGQEAIDRLALNPATAKIPIIMYSARDYSAEELPSRETGVIGVLSKPFTPQDVDNLLAKLGGTMKPPPVTAKLIRQPAADANVPEPMTTALTETSELVTPKLNMTSLSERVPAELKLAALKELAAHESRIVPTLRSVVQAAAPLAAQKSEPQIDSSQLEKCVADAVDAKSAKIQTQHVEHVEGEAQRAVGNALQFKQKQLEENVSLTVDTKISELQTLLIERVEGEAQRAVGNALRIKQQQLEDNVSLTVDSKLSALQVLLVDRVESETRRAVGAALKINQDNLENYIVEAVDAKLTVMQSRLVDQVNSDMLRSVEQMVGELFANGVRPHIQHLEECMRQAMTDLRYELLCSQEQVLDQRIPQLLDAVEQRQRQRVDALHSTLVTSMENAAAALCGLSR